MNFMSSVTALGAHDNTFCSDFISIGESKSLLAQMEMVEDKEADQGEAGERALHMFEVKEQVLSYVRCPRVYSRDSTRKNLLHASTSEWTNHC